jgi:hypothetical protein
VEEIVTQATGTNAAIDLEAVDVLIDDRRGPVEAIWELESLILTPRTKPKEGPPY